MGSIPLKIVSLMAVFSASLSAVAQATNIVDWSSGWRYYQAGMQPVGDWTSTNYSDAHWPTAPGVFGTPTDEMLRIPGLQITTPLVLMTNGANIITFYFRTTFELTPTNRLYLTASNLIDDGAVIYLNGREVRCLAMPSGAINYSTLATRSDDIITHGVETYDIPITNAVAGRNVLAVEVHQGSALSADAVFGMKLIAEVLETPVILRQPDNLTVEDRKSATFSVHATGSMPLSYRWYFTSATATNLISGATASNMTFIPSLTDNGRRFFAVITNRAGSETSRVATLTVIADTFGPRLVSATRRQSNQIDLLWDEAITGQSARAWSNYTVRIFGTADTIEITNVLVNPANFARLLLTQNLDASRDYVVCARNIEDRWTNVTASDCVGLTFMLSATPIPLASSWNFAIPFNETPATNWTQVNYALEEFWGEGLSMFAYETTPPFRPCSLLQTHLPIGLNTYYFRRPFTLSSDLGSNVVAVLRHAIDDGAVFYLNGAELLRVRMPAAPAPIAKETLATIRVEVHCETNSINLPAGLLRAGTNVLAVEVHQAADEASANDVAFDAELTLVYPRGLDGRDLIITGRRDLNGQVTTIQAEWTDAAWQLETSPDINGPWTVEPANGTLFQASPSGERRFFRLKGP